MYVYDQCAIFFGDAQSCLYGMNSPKFASDALKKQQHFNLQALHYLKQEHTIQGKLITHYPTYSPVIDKTRGDYLITHLKRYGLAVVTADCLPIIAYDRATKSVSIAHAGWRGSVQGIALAMLNQMTEHYGTCHENVQIWFGPSAGPCCYEVQEDFIHVVPYAARQQSIIERDNKFFFDGAAYNTELLKQLGIAPAQIDRTFNCCTICNTQFHSRRREGLNYVPQSTIVWLL